MCAGTAKPEAPLDLSVNICKGQKDYAMTIEERLGLMSRPTAINTIVLAPTVDILYAI